MKKANIFILVILIFLAVFVLGAFPGCTPKGPSFNTTALTMNFVENAPPSNINYGATFPIYVELNNVGGYDIQAQSAQVYLTGVGQNLVSVQPKLSNTNTLVKKTPQQAGGSEVLSFATIAQAAQQFPNAFNLTLKLTSCYNYATITQTTVCVGEGSSVCTLKDNKIVTGSNTAAPLQVTELTESVTGNKLYVYFKILNKGSGEVYLVDADCDKLQQEDINEGLKKNKVNLAVRLEEGFSCNLQASQAPYASIKALEGISQVGYTVTCEKTLTSAESHIAPIEIILSYKYRESTTKSMTILP